MHFKTGNLLDNVQVGIVAHCCNNIGLFGAGFAKQVRNRYPEAYRSFTAVQSRDLGEVNFVKVNNRLIVGNMVSMNGVYRESNPYPLCLDFLEICLQKVQSLAIHLDLPVHMPLIGSGLARGDWSVIRKLIEKNCPIATVWELPTKKSIKLDISISDLFCEEC
jgi:hypothetical protein